MDPAAGQRSSFSTTASAWRVRQLQHHGQRLSRGTASAPQPATGQGGRFSTTASDSTRAESRFPFQPSYCPSGSEVFMMLKKWEMDAVNLMFTRQCRKET
ncbi:hypothetical protein chiPu_0015695 [Chiloscyllium punctatum]|uniref:Uncharacterized protein n=1 Tax=Chiloscyllium punctatum TaxID=137246 RepID=A0A401T3K4_CHIPU|nr:hypothetical protein [Chiloscyllium punctatum]